MLLETYGTAHVQGYKQTCLMRRASRKFEDIDLRVGLVRHEEYTAREQLLMS